MSVENKAVRALMARREQSCAHARSPVQYSSCLVGAYCSHAILTTKIGVYHCPFGACFKKLENQKREVS